ncbi:ATP-binding protein [Asaia lannensis]|uniref:ATP-binding protein n=1 Tax=Asaia lannensis TaxID=415421 RepID=UPI0021BD4418
MFSPPMSNASDAVIRLLPRSLRARTNLLLIAGLCVVQAAGLTIHALDHLNIADRAEMHENEHHAFSIYHTLVELPPADREAGLAAIETPSNFKIVLDSKPDTHLPGAFIPIPLGLNPMMRGGPPPGMQEEGGFLPPGEMGGGEGRPPFPFANGPPPSGGFDAPPGEEHRMAAFMPPVLAGMGMLPPRLRPQRMIIGHKPGTRHYAMSLQMPDDHRWLDISYTVRPPNPFGSPTFMISFALMTICGGGLILWGSHRLIAPVATLANAATALGRDVNAQPLPESGPTEIRKAALAFNTMAARIRRFVTDRTLMLTAIGHDLRTPITRLKLRAEFIDDDELRDKFLADLDEMESMVAATLAFGRDSSAQEPMTTLDLGALLQTIADEAAEARPDLADQISYDEPEAAIRIKARSLSLKRALTNLVMNALKYGGSVSISVAFTRAPGQEKTICIRIDDSGPGLPQEDLERMFEPFVRAETSRNRETGGTGLGLAIARSTVRGQGGDVTLANRLEGGLRASVILPL